MSLVASASATHLLDVAGYSPVDVSRQRHVEPSGVMTVSGKLYVFVGF